ncbi:hypothetical protein [Bacillus pseudomycoides]|uniref:hypothetical protein n=1 Tax=Bacillus pseudomycoides TaxID=64104 RepID=UPI0001A1410F|nr:hypothetical protein [Bacillus pseudomycoides]EEM02570.1 hypothetical protein bmyco0002_50430 [Bacillus pseudomycoides]EEM07797.1 hypothetical protein bmyco0003_55340 [Bacillus pseudomycoides]KFN12557.1 hypothetical protein DJ94_1952 [Bacillus pseudomycoides]MDR4188994.1 hypothetical protein [Bacillus pseudomycoides]MED0857760.1 hypothetical protein [Bacillus pseudomycoides]
MKLMQANPEIFKDKIIKPSNYLIEHVGNNQYLLHREIAEYEKEAFRTEKLFQYKGRSFLPNIEQFTSEEQAKVAVYSYWKAINQLY